MHRVAHKCTFSMCRQEEKHTLLMRGMLTEAWKLSCKYFLWDCVSVNRVARKPTCGIYVLSSGKTWGLGWFSVSCPQTPQEYLWPEMMHIMVRMTWHRTDSPYLVVPVPGTHDPLQMGGHYFLLVVFDPSLGNIKTGSVFYDYTNILNLEQSISISPT